MPPKGYKNLPSIKKALFLELVAIASDKGKGLSELVHDVLGAYVQVAKGELPIQEWQRI